MVQGRRNVARGEAGETLEEGRGVPGEEQASGGDVAAAPAMEQ